VHFQQNRSSELKLILIKINQEYFYFGISLFDNINDSRFIDADFEGVDIDEVVDVIVLVAVLDIVVGFVVVFVVVLVDVVVVVVVVVVVFFVGMGLFVGLPFGLFLLV